MKWPSAGTIILIADSVECIVSVDHLSLCSIAANKFHATRCHPNRYSFLCRSIGPNEQKWPRRIISVHLLQLIKLWCGRQEEHAVRFLQFMMPQNENAIPTHCTITHSTLILFGALHECDHVAACQQIIKCNAQKLTNAADCCCMCRARAQ